MATAARFTAVLLALAPACGQIGDGLPGGGSVTDDTEETDDREPADDAPIDDDSGDDDSEQETEPAGTPLILAPAPNVNFEEIGAYSGVDGSYVRSFLDAPTYEMAGGTRPVHAAQGPGGRIYVVDENESILVFTADGVFTGPSDAGGDGSGPGAIEVTLGDGYYSVKSIDFHGGKLYATTTEGIVTGYSLTGKPQSHLLDLGASENLEDIHFLDDGRFLISNATADQVQLYGADGELDGVLLSVDFPQQIQPYGDNFLVTSWMEDEVIEFDLSGEVGRHGGEGIENPRGIAPLSNGNILLSVYLGSCADDGCQLVEMTDSAAVVNTRANGPAVRRLEAVVLP